jgi:sugar phosphate isomerase/epimerase
MAFLTRRSLLASSAASLLPLSAAKEVPMGIELYAVREALEKNLMGTVKAVAKLGYKGVEFYSPYMEWTPEYAKQVRSLLNDLGIQCYSTHNSNSAFTPEKLSRMAELNSILGSKYLVMASGPKVTSLDGWKKVAEQLNFGAAGLKASGLKAGFHNHDVEFRPLEGKRPMEVLAKETTKDVILQLDIGTCIEAGSDPVEWINQNPGRIRSLHCKDWSPQKGYRVLFGEGVAKWPEIFAAATKRGGVEYYLMEQEGYDLPEIETVDRCLKNYQKLKTT